MAWPIWSRSVLWFNGSNPTLFSKVSINYKFIVSSTIFKSIINGSHRQIGVGHQSISMIWTARAIGVFCACTMSGLAFGSSWMNTTRRKLVYFGLAHFIISASLFTVPFLFNLIQTLVVFGFMTFSTGSYDVADNGFVHQLLGTQYSRPIIQSLHACASLGFLSCKFEISILSNL